MARLPKHIPGIAAWIVGLLLFYKNGDSSLLICLSLFYFAGEDFRTGCWLWRRDPQPSRAWTWFLGYLSWGLLKVSLVALAVMIRSVLLSREVSGVDEELLVTAIASGVCILGSTMVGWLFLYSLLTERWTVAIDPAVVKSFRRNEFPPQLSGRNRLGALMLNCVLVSSLLAISIGVLSVFFEIYPVIAISLLFLFVSPWVVLVCYDRVRIVMRRSKLRVNCWPEYFIEGYQDEGPHSRGRLVIVADGTEGGHLEWRDL